MGDPTILYPGPQAATGQIPYTKTPWPETILNQLGILPQKFRLTSRARLLKKGTDGLFFNPSVPFTVTTIHISGR